MNVTTLAAYLCFAGCALLIVYVAADLLSVARRLQASRPASNRVHQSPPRALPELSVPPPPAEPALVAHEVAAPSLPTSTQALDVVLNTKCPCGANELRGSPMDCARVCTACCRVWVVYRASRCALVPVSGWQAWSSWQRVGSLGGDA